MTAQPTPARDLLVFTEAVALMDTITTLRVNISLAARGEYTMRNVPTLVDELAAKEAALGEFLDLPTLAPLDAVLQLANTLLMFQAQPDIIEFIATRYQEGF